MQDYPGMGDEHIDKEHTHKSVNCDGMKIQPRIYTPLRTYMYNIDLSMIKLAGHYYKLR
jgi:hypothetical protein